MNKWFGSTVVMVLLALLIGWQLGVMIKVDTLSKEMAALQQGIRVVQDGVVGLRETVDAKIPQPTPVEPLEEECWRMSAAVPTEYGVVLIGESLLCGVGLRNAATYGPDIDAHLTRTEGEIGRLTEEIERWQLCAIKKICPQDLLESVVVR